MLNRTTPLRSIEIDELSSDNQNHSIEQFNKVSTVQNNNVVSIFGEKTADAKSEVKVILTDDRDLLQKYYELRHYAYRDENGWKDYNGYENENDRNGRIAVAIQDGEVVGGMRLMFSDECEHMSNEIAGTKYNYREIMTKYDKRENLVFSEISAIVVAKKNRDRSVTTKMFDLLLSESKKHQCNYMFGVGVAVVCREYRMIFRSLGHDVEIVISFPWKQRETYNLARMFPMYTKFQ